MLSIKFQARIFRDYHAGKEYTDGSETTPARYFGVDRIEDVFIPWSDVKGERWPGEY